jgi:signal transduction histidine kinase
MFDRIRLRLTAAYVGILALILVLFGVVAVFVFRDQAYARQDELLMQEARSKAESLLKGREEDFIPTPGQPYAAWAEVAPDGRISDPQSAPAEVLDLLSMEQAKRAVREREPSLATVEGHEGALRVASLPVVREGAVVAVVQTGQLREEVGGNVSRLVLVLAITGLGALVLATVGGHFMSRRAMRPVRESFERQRTFIADASHELKTPLTLIRADAEVLSRDLTDPDRRELAYDLLAETDRMNALLSDLLTLARLDAGKLAVERKPFDLASTIAETTERFAARASAEGKDLEVRFGPADGEIPARGDARRTGQILAALLDNALRFTPPGGLITVEGDTRDGRALATVTDTGPGIASEHLPRVFDRFYRAEAARTRSEAGGGTGLGLSIARDLARAQGGDLTAANVPGGGASFTLSLPAGP